MASTLIFLHFTVPSLLLLLLPALAAAQSPQNITLGSSLSPLGRTTSWSSPSGDFAVGFRRLESDSSLFLLAIWFVKVPNQTVVWVANRKTPVQGGSKFELSNDGRLVLRDHTGEEVWSPPGVSAANITHAAMLDSGNFVLVRGGFSDYAWESFDAPTDTILPSQVLPLGSQLTSRLMESDYSDGRFQLRVQDDGNLVFYILPVTSCPSGANCDPYDSYYLTDTVGDGDRLNFSGAGDINFVLNNGSFIEISSAAVFYSTREFYHRASLDPDGVLRHYAYPRNATGAGAQGGEWTVGASFPSDVCMGVSFFGSGICGYNSYCRYLDATSQRLSCECPPQYSFIDPDRKYKGCKPDFDPQSCAADDGGTGPAVAFEIVRMLSIDWPQSDYEHLKPLTPDECSKACLNDCFCAVAVHEDDGCWKKKLPLAYGRLNPGQVKKMTLVKVSRGYKVDKNSSVHPPISPQYFTTKRNERTWLLIFLGGSNCLLLAAIFLLTCCCYRKKMHGKLQRESNQVSSNLRSFSYKALEEATQGFQEELGRGAFGIVYKGIMESDFRTLVAVKKLQDLDEAAEKEFTNEVKIIAQTHHKNLVKLLGYCDEGSHRLLVYEYMSNGSLVKFLTGSVKPEWNTRTRIAFGVARGLLYLHEECDTQIIHCDIKPQNILLDDYFNARIADFGLAKLLGTDQTRTNTGIRGTRGYVSPEWFKHVAITSKVDVYSFGIVLLEIICCRRSVEPDIGDEEKTVLAFWAYDCFRAGRLDMLVENEEQPLADMRELERLVMVAIWCIQEEPSRRPTMKKVTQMLECAVEVPTPPDPSSSLS